MSPQINFSNTWTRGPLDNSAAAPFGQDFASFLLGLPTGGTMSRPAAYREKSTVLSFFAHDDWRVRHEPDAEPRRPLGDREPAHGGRGPVRQRLRLRHRRCRSRRPRRPTTPRNPIAEVPVDQFRVRGGLLYPDTGGPTEAWERNLGNVMPRAGIRVAGDAEDVDSRRLRHVLRRARHQPHHGQPGGLFARHAR